MTIKWRGPINQLLYGLIFVRELTDDVVEFYADAAVSYKLLGLGPEAYCRAIDEALASGERLDGLSMVPQFDQAQIAGYLRALAARLQELRPWPEPKFRRLDDPDAWARFEHAVPIARLDSWLPELLALVRGPFRPIGDTQPGMSVLMLTLQTGETVALLDSDRLGEQVTLMTDAAVEPSVVIEHFTDATGFPAAKIAPIQATSESGE